MDFSLQNNPFLPLFQHYPPPDPVSTGKTGSTPRGVMPKPQLPHGAEFLASLFTPPPVSSSKSVKSLTSPYPPQPNFLYPPINPLLASTSWFQQALSSSMQAGVLPLPPRLPREPCLPVLPPQSPNSIAMARKPPRRIPSTSQPSFKSRSPPPDRFQQQQQQQQPHQLQQQQSQVPVDAVPPKCQPTNWNAIYREQVEKTHSYWRTSELPRPLCSLQLQETGTLVPSLIDGEVIMGFNVWGEKRLCLPHLFRFVLNDVDLRAIDEACTQLQITCTTCSPAQLTLLHSRKILPPAVSSCGLIRKSDAERLIKFIRNRLDAAPVDLAGEASDDRSTSSDRQPVKVTPQGHCKDRPTLAGPVDEGTASCADTTGDQDDSKAVDDVEMGNRLGDSTASSELPSKSTSAPAEDVEMIPTVDKAGQPSTASNDSDSIPVVHECFGRQLGLVHPDLYKQASSKCIECQTCHRLFAPDQFVGHTHTVTEVENLSHWGFDSTNWRCYLRLYTGRRLLGCKTLHGANKTTTVGDNDKEPPFNVTEVHRRLEQFKIKFAQPIKLPASLSAALRTIGICASVAPIPPSAPLPPPPPVVRDGRRPADVPPMLSLCGPQKFADHASQRSSASSLGHAPSPSPSPLSTAQMPLVVLPEAHPSTPAAIGSQNPLLLPQLTLRRLWAPNDGRIKVPPPPIPNVKRDRKILPKKLNTGPPLVLHSHRVIARPATNNYDRDFIPNVCLLPSLSVTKASGGASAGGMTCSSSGKSAASSSRYHRRSRRPGVTTDVINGDSSVGRSHRSRRQHQCRETSRSDNLSGVSRSCSSGSSPHWSPGVRCSRSNSSSGRSQNSRRSGQRSDSAETATSSVMSSTSSSCRTRSVSFSSSVNSSPCSRLTRPPHLSDGDSLAASKTPALDQALQMETNMVGELVEPRPFWKRRNSQDLISPATGRDSRLRRAVSLPTLSTPSGSPLGASSSRSAAGSHSSPRRPRVMRRSFSLSKSLLDLRARTLHANSSRKHGKPNRLGKRHPVNSCDTKLTERKCRRQYEKEYFARQNRALAAAKAAQGFASRVAPGLWTRHFETLNKGGTGPPDLPNARPTTKATTHNNNNNNNSGDVGQIDTVSQNPQREPTTSGDPGERPGLASGLQPPPPAAFTTPVLVTSPAKNSLPAAVLALEAIWSDLVRHISEYTLAVESKSGVVDARQRLFEQFISMQTYYATQIASLMAENRRLTEKLSSITSLHKSSSTTASSTVVDGLSQMASPFSGESFGGGSHYPADPEGRGCKRPLDSPARGTCQGQARQPSKLSLAEGSVSEAGKFSGHPSPVHPPTPQTLYPHKSRKETVRSPIARRQPSLDSTSTEASKQSHDEAAIATVCPSKPRLYERKVNNTPPVNPLLFTDNPVDPSRYRATSESYTNHSDCEGSLIGTARYSQLGKTGADKDEMPIRKRHNSVGICGDTVNESDMNCASPDGPIEGVPPVDMDQGGRPWHAAKDAHLQSGTGTGGRTLGRGGHQWNSFPSFHRQEPRQQTPMNEQRPQRYRHGPDRPAASNSINNKTYHSNSKRSASHVLNDADCWYDSQDAEARFYRNNGETGDCRTAGCQEDESDPAPPEYKRRTLMPPSSTGGSGGLSQSFMPRFNHSPRMTLKPTSQKSNH